MSTDLLAAAADAFHALGRSLEGAGHPDAAIHLHSAASVLDRTLPQQPSWWSNPFNGQEGRCRLFLQMLEALRPAAVVETGTFRGTTAAFIAAHFKGPIFTCEVDRRWYLTAQAALAAFPKVDIRLQDSRAFLSAILAEIKEGLLLCYLDAHWQEELPVAAELDLILSSGRPAAVMIDDFASPFDAEYRFDDYGSGKALTLELLAQVRPRGASLFFPTLPARQETGAQRGCAVIGVGHATAALDGLAELRRHEWPKAPEIPGAIPPTVATRPDIEPLQRLLNGRYTEEDLSAARANAELHQQAAATLRETANALRDESNMLRDTANALRDESNMLRETANALRDQRDILHDETINLAVERDSLRAEVAALRVSTSWRITAPLRSMRRLLKP